MIQVQNALNNAAGLSADGTHTATVYISQWSLMREVVSVLASKDAHALEELIKKYESEKAYMEKLAADKNK